MIDANSSSATDTIVVYHRCGGKSLGYPPNTLLTAKWAAAHGAKAIEYDVVVAEDGDAKKVFVIEPKLLKVANVDINHVQWRDVKELNVGNDTFGRQTVVCLEDMLAAIDENKTAHQIHLKGTHPATVATVLAKVKSIHNYVVTTFDISVIKEIKSIDKDVPVGWLVQPQQESGSEGGTDLTAKVTAANANIPPYTSHEIDAIITTARENHVDIVLLCGPRVQDKSIVDRIHSEKMGVGAWGVGTNISLARTLIAFGLDRFTLDNPEELS